MVLWQVICMIKIRFISHVYYSVWLYFSFAECKDISHIYCTRCFWIWGNFITSRIDLKSISLEFVTVTGIINLQYLSTQKVCHKNGKNIYIQNFKSEISVARSVIMLKVIIRDKSYNILVYATKSSFLNYDNLKARKLALVSENSHYN